MWLGSCFDVAVVASTALIRPLAWDPPHVTGAALKRLKKHLKIKEFLKIILAPPTPSVHLEKSFHSLGVCVLLVQILRRSPWAL